MRGTIDALFTAAPLGPMLPAIFQEDEFSMRFVSGFDDVIAPVLLTLDCLIDYFDPALTPVDFLDWLAGWVGIEIDESWATERRRAAVATAVEMYRMRGTITGLRANLEVLSGGTVEITDSGGVSWSTHPMGELPGQESPRLAVRVTIPDELTDRKQKAIDSIVATAKPAHVVHRVEVVGS
ncbi:MAG TPA: phage tail protein I [Jatrophihabitans sp.]|jgi:phage tail-like protein|uniref:phage tail protein I n=1 Tax=Jatrophihabitans sp. TaxID=1932789 RepID=UPI002E0C649F|nr:phage tail protein I [Jatrophihabitans sp.]